MSGTRRPGGEPIGSRKVPPRVSFAVANKKRLGLCGADLSRGAPRPPIEVSACSPAKMPLGDARHQAFDTILPFLFRFFCFFSFLSGSDSLDRFKSRTARTPCHAVPPFFSGQQTGVAWLMPPSRVARIEPPNHSSEDSDEDEDDNNNPKAGAQDQPSHLSFSLFGLVTRLKSMYPRTMQVVREEQKEAI